MSARSTQIMRMRAGEFGEYVTMAKLYSCSQPAIMKNHSKEWQDNHKAPSSPVEQCKLISDAISGVSTDLTNRIVNGFCAELKWPRESQEAVALEKELSAFVSAELKYAAVRYVAALERDRRKGVTPDTPETFIYYELRSGLIGILKSSVSQPISDQLSFELPEIVAAWMEHLVLPIVKISKSEAPL